MGQEAVSQERGPAAGIRAETIVVDGLATRVLRAGRGEPVLLLHGLGASAYSWRHVLPALAEEYEVFAPDLPGFGRSDKPRDFDYSLRGMHRWVLALLDRLGLARARFVGNSLGGLITLWTAMDTPQRVERMALLGTPAYLEDRPLVLAPLTWPLVGQGLEMLIGPRCVRFLARRLFVDPCMVTDELVREYSSALATADGRRAVAEVMRRAIPPDGRQRIARYNELEQRALVVVGDRDSMVDRDSAARLAKDLGRARLAVIDRCGHAPQEEAPERVVPLLRGFLA